MFLKRGLHGLSQEGVLPFGLMVAPGGVRSVAHMLVVRATVDGIEPNYQEGGKTGFSTGVLFQ